MGNHTDTFKTAPYRRIEAHRCIEIVDQQPHGHSKAFQHHFHHVDSKETPSEDQHKRRRNENPSSQESPEPTFRTLKCCRRAQEAELDVNRCIEATELVQRQFNHTEEDIDRASKIEKQNLTTMYDRQASLDVPSPLRLKLNVQYLYDSLDDE